MEFKLIPTTISVKDDSGTLLFETEAVYLDILLGECQRSSKEIDRWLPEFTRIINVRHNTNLTQTQAYFLATASTNVIRQLKKNTEFTPMSQTSMDSTPDT